MNDKIEITNSGSDSRWKPDLWDPALVELIEWIVKINPNITWDWDILEINFWTFDWEEMFLEGEINKDWEEDFFYIDNIRVPSNLRWNKLWELLLKVMKEEVLSKWIKLAFWIVRDDSALKLIWRFFWKENLVFYNSDLPDNNKILGISYEMALNWTYVSTWIKLI